MTKLYEPKPENISFPSIEEIYKKSIIDWNDYYDMITVLSVKTSNSFFQIEAMPFHKFNALINALNKYIEQENKQNNGGAATDQNNIAQEQMKNNMSQAKNMFSSIKPPKLK